LSNLLGEFLDPIDALFVIFYSILFALLFTLSYGILIYHGIISSSFATGYSRELFFTILGAITAWGIIDGVLYILGANFARSERHRLLQHVQSSDNEEEAATAIANELDFILEPITSAEQRHALYHDIRAHLSLAEPQAMGIQRADVVGAIATVVLYIVAVLPSLLPLLLLPNNTALAIRISNLVSFIMVFAAGYIWGIHTSTNPWKKGLLLTSVCLAMVVVAMLIGG
jgi:VIT1/CCC1 family predicted Fe2+/Mn2+ transporter